MKYDGKVTPDVVLLCDSPGHGAADEFARGTRAAARSLDGRITVFLDHDVPAGSFETAFTQKKLIDFARQTGAAFHNAEGVGYHVLSRSLRPGQLLVTCGRHGAYVGGVGAVGLRISEAEMAHLLADGQMELPQTEVRTVTLTGQMGPGVNGWDCALVLSGSDWRSRLAGAWIRFVDRTTTGLSVDDRQRICLTAADCGAVTELFAQAPDDAADGTSPQCGAGDGAAALCLDLGTVQPMAAQPGEAHVTGPVTDLPETRVDACFIGGCAGGHLDDLRKAAAVLRGRRIRRELRLLVGAVDNETYLDAVHEGLIDVFLDAGAQVTNPGCASCRTTSIGVVGDGETLVSTGCYHYPGCAGTEASQVFLANAETVARAALTGRFGGAASAENGGI